jgi:hypothetical protein
MADVFVWLRIEEEREREEAEAPAVLVPGPGLEGVTLDPGQGQSPGASPSRGARADLSRDLSKLFKSP